MISPKKPSAKARTISLFTGKTDIEGGITARDGTLPEELQRRTMRCRDYWQKKDGTMSAWEFGRQTRHAFLARGEVKRVSSDLYEARAHGKKTDHETIGAAGQWVESECAR